MVNGDACPRPPRQAGLLRSFAAIDWGFQGPYKYPFDCHYPCVHDHATCACPTAPDQYGFLETCDASQCGAPTPGADADGQLFWDPATKCLFGQNLCATDVAAAAQDAGDFLAHVAAGAEA
jgi:hypothetical protein